MEVGGGEEEEPNLGGEQRDFFGGGRKGQQAEVRGMDTHLFLLLDLAVCFFSLFFSVGRL